MFLSPIVKTDERVVTWVQNFIKAYRPRSGVMPYHMGLTQSYRGTNIASSMIRMESESLMILAFLTPLLKKLMSRSMMRNFCQLLQQPVKMNNRMMIR